LDSRQLETVADRKYEAWTPPIYTGTPDTTQTGPSCCVWCVTSRNIQYTMITVQDNVYNILKNHASEKAVYKLRKRLICLGGPTARLVRFVSECVGRRRHCRCDRRTHSDAERTCRAVGPTRYSHRLTRHRQHCLVVSGGRCELGITWLEAGIAFTHEQRRSRR